MIGGVLMVEPVMRFRGPSETVLGNGISKKVGDYVRGLGARRVLLVCDAGVASTGESDRAIARLEDAGIQVQGSAMVSGEPTFDLAERWRSVVARSSCDAVVALGGGSAIDVAKAAAIGGEDQRSLLEQAGVDRVETALPIITIPTTSGTGSEVTPNCILIDPVAREKIGIVSGRLIPRVALVDPELTLTVPPPVTANTGMDALTHALEAYVSLNASPITEVLSELAMHYVAANLRTAVRDGNDIGARYGMSVASVTAGMAFANAGLGLVHAIAMALGGKVGTAHGLANAIVLPHVMEFNAEACPEKFACIHRIFCLDDDCSVTGLSAKKAPEDIRRLATDIGIPATLREVGVTREQVPSIAEAAIAIKRLVDTNPRKCTYEDIVGILDGLV